MPISNERTFYVLRHVASGELMPLLERGRGYSSWDPGNDEMWFRATLPGIPRLFPSERAARCARTAWAAGVHKREEWRSGEYGEEIDEVIVITPCGRSVEMMDVVPVRLAIGG